MTNETGHFSFFTPVGTYRLDVSRSGYQPYRSVELDVVDEPVHYDVPLTAQIAETAHHVVVIDEYGFEPAYLEIRPGEIVEWVNMSTDGHTATNGQAQMGAADVGDAAFDSGLILSGEQYKFRFDTEEIYQLCRQYEYSQSGHHRRQQCRSYEPDALSSDYRSVAHSPESLVCSTRPNKRPGAARFCLDCRAKFDKICWTQCALLPGQSGLCGHAMGSFRKQAECAILLPHFGLMWFPHPFPEAGP